MAGPVPPAIVLALGAGALGAPDALRLLLQSAGRSPAVDLVICLVVITVATAHLLGTILLVRFVRKARAGSGAAGAPSTNLFAQMTTAVSVGAAFLVTACLVAVPGGLPLDFAVLLHLLIPDLPWLRPIVNMSVGVAIATVAGTTLLVWCSHRARNAAGAGGAGAAAPSPARYTRRFCKLMPLMAVAVFSLACLAGIVYSAPELEPFDGDLACPFPA